MTLRTIENEFAELLQKQMHDHFPLDLTLEGPIVSHIHPKILWAKLSHERQLLNPVENAQIGGWYFEAFKDLNQAEKKYPGIQLKFVGKPWSFHQFLEGHVDQAMIDFPDIGAAVLSKTELPRIEGNELHHHLIPLWLNYALSPELWGSIGKWPRFHSRLHELFKSRDLLSGNDDIGYYPLKLRAETLQTHGYLGTSLDKTYLLVLPWTFSLTALCRLEEIIRQEY